LEIKVLSGEAQGKELSHKRRNPLRAATTTDERVKSLKEI
jgi:hypothetical protein